MAFREHTDFRRQTHACRSLTKHGNVLLGQYFRQHVAPGLL